MKLPYDRRTGRDRRQADLPPVDNKERRRSVESRKPEIVEISISEDEWMRYFGNLARAAKTTS